MQKEKGKRKKVKARLLSLFLFPLATFLVSCGAPADPTPPQPLVPEAIKDLAARQSGDAVVLTFTLPAKTTEGDVLAAPPAIEIFRGFTEPKRQALAQVYTVPSALVETYLSEGRVRFVDPLKPEDVQRGALFYMVRTRAAKRRASDDSNLVSLRVLPVPERIREVRARVTESAIELEWIVPERTTTGAPIASLAGYRVYRAELDPGAEVPADLSQAKLKTPFELVGPSPAPSFRDTRFEFGRAYLYVVRSVIQQNLDSAESPDSELAVVTPRDTFPPAAPQNLVAVLVPATPEAPAQVELSWSISPEPDLAGYHVYRSEGEGTPGERLTRELLLVPTFRDISVAAGGWYSYSVTAVDRAGNESPRSAPVTAEVPGTSK